LVIAVPWQGSLKRLTRWPRSDGDVLAVVGDGDAVLNGRDPDLMVISKTAVFGELRAS